MIYRELKKSTKVTQSQRSDIERIKLIKNGKRMGIDKVTNQKERIINHLKSQV